MDARRAVKRVLLFGSLFAAGVLFFNFVVMPTLVHQRGAVIVPDLRNLSETQAAKTLSRVGLTMRVDRAENDPQVPEGYVISQAPRANDTLKEGRTVSVVLSSGPRVERVPETKGMTLRQSREVLEHARLRVGRVAKVLRRGEGREEVVASNPPSGEEVGEGAAVDLVVSVASGGRAYLMPDFSGGDLLFVRDKLERMGFRVSSVRYEPREGVYPNTIVDQQPKPGRRIREGESIELVASSSR